MARMEQTILTNMCMVERDDGKILVQNRKNKDWPGITFPGGHVERDESFVDSVIREVLEETGLLVSALELCGTKQFQTSNGVRYIVLMYKAKEFTGEVQSSDEGEIFWIDKETLKEYELANDFEMMYEVMVSNQFTEFYYDSERKVHLK
jgi:8-oxo-dGTP diphosphatase